VLTRVIVSVTTKSLNC